MSIGSSDFSKPSLSNLQLRQDQQVAVESFQLNKQQEAKAVQAGADTQGTAQDNAGQDSDPKGDKKAAPTVDSNKAKEVSQKMGQLNVQLSFEVSDDGADSIVKVIDQETGKVVRQIPSEEFLKMSSRIDDVLNELGDIKGALVSNQA